MKRINLLLAIVLFGIILTSMISASKASAEQGSCYLKAIRTDVFVIVYDMDFDGNMGYQIWQGRIDKGQEVLINTPHGRFRYYANAQPDFDQPLSGGISRLCNNKRRVGVP
jgi:hypothetical protein